MMDSSPLRSLWRVDGDNWLLSPLGTRVARIEDGALKLYDKHAKTSFSLTVEDFQKLTQDVDAKKRDDG